MVMFSLFLMRSINFLVSTERLLSCLPLPLSLFPLLRLLSSSYSSDSIPSSYSNLAVFFLTVFFPIWSDNIIQESKYYFRANNQFRLANQYIINMGVLINLEWARLHCSMGKELYWSVVYESFNALSAMSINFLQYFDFDINIQQILWIQFNMQSVLSQREQLLKINLSALTKCLKLDSKELTPQQHKCIEKQYELISKYQSQIKKAFS